MSASDPASRLAISGIDLATTVSGVATARGTQAITVSKAAGNTYRRHWLMASQVVTAAVPCDLAVIEDVPHLRGRTTIIKLAELGGLVRTSLVMRGVRLLLVTPSSLKAYATGSGSADKQGMLDALEQRASRSWQVTSDEVDAFWLRDLGCWLWQQPALGPHQQITSKALATISQLTDLEGTLSPRGAEVRDDDAPTSDAGSEASPA